MYRLGLEVHVLVKIYFKHLFLKYILASDHLILIYKHRQNCEITYFPSLCTFKNSKPILNAFI